MNLNQIWKSVLIPISLVFTHLCPHRELNKNSEVKIVHTSVHGVGHIFVQAAFKAFDLHPPYAVEEQKDPDPEFPTVKYPNPEEGEGVLVQYTDTHTNDIRTFFFWFCYVMPDGQ